MSKSVKFRAKDNDVIFKLFQNYNDIGIDEIWVQIEGEKDGWLIFGYKDLQNAIAKAEKKFNPEGLIICPQCKRKHKETQLYGFCCAACYCGY